MSMGDLVFHEKVKCPICGHEWREAIAADVEGIQCRKCKCWLKIEAKFTLKLFGGKE